MKLVWWLVGMLGAGLVSIYLSNAGTTAPVQNVGLAASAPLAGALRDIAEPVNDVFLGFTDQRDLRDENERLREEIETLKNQLASQQNADQRVLDLEAALGLKQSRPEDRLLAADVIAVEPSGLRRMVAINRGLDDGLDEGMVVLSRAGSVVGTVSRAYADFAWIRLITDPDSAINAQVNIAPAPAGGGTEVITPGGPGETPAPSPAPAPTAPPDNVRAVAMGDQRRGMILDLLPSDAPVNVGDLVVTSGLGGNYPRGLLLGSISHVEERPQAPFKSALIEPSAELSGLETVLVLVSFKPARLTAP